MHAYDASRRSKRNARMGRAAQMSVARLVGVQGVVQNNGKVKSVPKYLAVKNLQYVLNELFLVLFLLSWLLWWTDLLVLFFVRVTSRWLHSALASALDSAK